MHGALTFRIRGEGFGDGPARRASMQNVYRYDVMAAGAASDNDKILSYVNGDPNVQSALNVQISTVKLKNAAGKEEKAQMIVVPGDEPLAEYIGLYNLKDEEIGPLDGEILVTQNAANVLGFAAGDQVEIQDQDLNQREVTVSGLVRNYLGNNVYMTEKTYESLFGDYEPNGVFLKLSEECSDEIAYADDLGGKEGIVSYTSKQELSDEFSDAFTLINMVVYSCDYHGGGARVRGFIYAVYDEYFRAEQRAGDD